MEIDAETVRRMARLACLELDDDEVPKLQQDLDRILGYVAKLRTLDTADVPPTTHVLDLETPLRADEVRDVLTPEEAVRNAPEHTDHAMVVPKVLE